MVSNEYLGRHPLAFDDTKPRQNGEAKILPTMRHRARPHRPEHHWLDRQAEEDFEFKDGDAGGMYMQDEVPTVRQIRLGRGKGGSDEGEEKPEKRACGELDTEGCIFFRALSVPSDGECQ